MPTIAALYHFAPLADPAARQAPLLDLCAARGVRGTLILAREGINGTIAGPRQGIDAVLAHVRAWPGFAALEWKESPAGALPFGRMKVRLKPEIVTMGRPGVDPTARVGRHVAPADWNAVLSDPGTVVIDLDPSTGVLTMHVLDRTDPADLQAERLRVAALEDRVRRALGKDTGQPERHTHEHEKADR